MRNITIAAIVTVVAVTCSSAKAQPSDDWVDKLNNANGNRCCQDNDGRRYPVWDTLGKVVEGHNGASGYRIFDEGMWKDVPNWAMVNEANLDGIPRVWFESVQMPYDGVTRRVKCFLVGSLG